MKIFVQSASLQQIRKIVESGFADGIVLSPIDLAAEDPSIDVKDRMAEMAEEFGVPICVPVSAVLGGDVYRDGRELARASDHAIIQIPFLEDTVSAIRKLVADGVSVCATYVYSGAQAFFAAKVGATMVSVDVQDIDAHARHSAEAVEQIRAVLDRSGLECDLAVGTAQNSVNFSDYLLAGADTAVVTPELLNSLMLHSLTDRAVDRYLSALSKRHKPRSL
ncbi:MAG: transaldolase family protein [Gemmatimonadaceae bacterium]